MPQGKHSVYVQEHDGKEYVNTYTTKKVTKSAYERLKNDPKNKVVKVHYHEKPKPSSGTMGYTGDYIGLIHIGAMIPHFGFRKRRKQRGK